MAQTTSESAHTPPPLGEKFHEVQFEHSAQFPLLLEQLNVSLLVSTYQAGKLLVIGSHAGKLRFSFHSFEQVMGVAVGADRMAVGTRRQVYFLKAEHSCAPTLASEVPHDQCWISRTSAITGSIHGHELAWGRSGLWVVNTLFSSLCTLSQQFNFVPRWQPPFISELIDQDRCHLNGLAMESGSPRFVTVLGETNEPAGWRKNKVSGGAILEVPSGQTLCRGLCMPHSPRVHNGQLWFCNSGMGHLTRVDRSSGKLLSAAALPGYTRGLAIHNDIAFVGLSKIRETNIFGGLPIGEYSGQLRCGVGVIDTKTGKTLATLQFHTGVEEIFAVEVIPNSRNPKLMGPSIDPEEKEVWVVPKESLPTEVPADSYFQQLTENNGSELTSMDIASLDEAEVDIEALTHEGLRAHQQGNLQVAINCYRRAIKSGTPTAELLSQFGNLHQDLDDPSAAMACYLQAVAIDPDHAPAQQNLGVLYATMNQPVEALKHFELAQQANPHPMNFVLAANVLPVIYQSMDQLNYWRGRLENRVAAIVDSGAQIDTETNAIPTSFFFAYQGRNDRGLMENLAKIYRGSEYCSQANLDDHKVPRKRIRVGFVSSYFCNHTIGRLNLGVIERLSRADFEVNVISLRSHNDSYSALYRKGADHFIELPRQPDVARQAIADMGLDILIFTDIGMDCLTQALCYSRMAPIQAMTWGHPDTSGSPNIDYFISSALAEPESAQEHYSERLALLDTMGVYYPRPQLPEIPSGKSYFGLNPQRRAYLCPQTLFKFHPEFDEVLRGVLESDSEGELVLIESRKTSWNDALRTRWQETLPGVHNRIRFLPAQPRDEFLKLLRVADVMLDPFPFCGGNTTYEALAMETPVVTLPGTFLRGRLTYAMYQRMNLGTMIVNNPREYVELAVRLANDHEASAEARRAIQETSGILFENQADVSAYERMLRRWCGRV